MIIPSEVKNLFNRQSLVAFGTADKNGQPNVSVVFWKKIMNDNTILLIDNFMKASKANISESNKVCISFWDPDTEEAYKLKGIAKYHTEGSVYEEGKNLIQSKNANRIPKGVVEVKITEIYTIKPGPDAGKKII